MTRLIAETITPPSASPVCWPVFIRLIIPIIRPAILHTRGITSIQQNILIWLIISLAGINAALGIVVIRILPARHLARLRLPGNRSPLGIFVLKALVIIRLIIIIIHLNHTPMFDQERRKATPIPKAT